MENSRGILVDKKKNLVRINFATALYRSESIRSAARDFAPACTVRLASFENRINVVITPKTRGVALETLGREFANYALAKTRENIA